MRDDASSAVAAWCARRDASAVVNVWTLLVDDDALQERAAELDALAPEKHGPLHGVAVAIKDNIDVAGLPTTAGAPSYAYVPAVSAPVVARLEAAGAIVVGKTNLDQFATGLSGTRAPAFGVCPNPLDSNYIAGGSSSGSAVAVASGLVPLAVGTDTAGSGRVPAACCGVVGLKPTRTWMSTAGVVPASPSFDTVSLFSASVGAAARAFLALADSVPPSSLPRRIGIPRSLEWFGDDDASGRFDAYVAGMAEREELELVPVEIGPFLAAGSLLYGSALLAERDASFGDFLRAHPEECDPAVRKLVLDAARHDAASVFRAQQQLAAARVATATTWNAIDLLMLPTIARHPTIAEALADSIATSAQLGTYTTFVNLLDLAAISFPAGERASGLPFGVTAIGPAGSDGALIRFAAECAGEPAPTLPALPRIVVVGAHLRGMPLNEQLVSCGARFVAATTTSPHYRLYDLGTDPPKPGMVRDPNGGAAIAVEVWELDIAAFGAFVAAIPPPLGIGTVELVGGTRAPGFLCEPYALAATREITEFGGWRAYLEAQHRRD